MASPTQRLLESFERHLKEDNQEYDLQSSLKPSSKTDLSNTQEGDIAVLRNNDGSGVRIYQKQDNNPLGYWSVQEITNDFDHRQLSGIDGTKMKIKWKTGDRIKIDNNEIKDIIYELVHNIFLNNRGRFID